MTKKDYELFANEIHSLCNPGERDTMFEVCSRVFKQDNPAFQQEKFRRACYEGKHIRKSISQ